MNSFDRATTAQRHTMLRLLKRAEYDERTCTLAHRRLAQEAAVQLPMSGDRVDDWIGNMTKNAASRIIRTLEAEINDE